MTRSFWNNYLQKQFSVSHEENNPIFRILQNENNKFSHLPIFDTDTLTEL